MGCTMGCVVVGEVVGIGGWTVWLGDNCHGIKWICKICLQHSPPIDGGVDMAGLAGLAAPPIGSMFPGTCLGMAWVAVVMKFTKSATAAGSRGVLQKRPENKNENTKPSFIVVWGPFRTAPWFVLVKLHPLDHPCLVQ